MYIHINVYLVVTWNVNQMSQRFLHDAVNVKLPLYTVHVKSIHCINVNIKMSAEMAWLEMSNIENF